MVKHAELEYMTEKYNQLLPIILRAVLHWSEKLSVLLKKSTARTHFLRGF